MGVEVEDEGDEDRWTIGIVSTPGKGRSAVRVEVARRAGMRDEAS